MDVNKRGQVGLLLLVVLGLVISIVLSIASKSLSDVVLSRQEKENSAAFQLAERGVEAALLAIGSDSIPGGGVEIEDPTGAVTGEYAVTEVDNFELYVKEGGQAEIDLSGYALPSLEISWTARDNEEEKVECVGEGSGNAPAAMEVIAILSSGEVERSYYNAFGCNLANNFLSAEDGGSTYLSKVEYTLPLGTSLLRLRPLYNGATILVQGTGLAKQMYLIEAKASGGDAGKEIEVKRTRDVSESVFDYALFTEGTIVK